VQAARNLYKLKGDLEATTSKRKREETDSQAASKKRTREEAEEELAVAEIDAKRDELNAKRDELNAKRDELNAKRERLAVETEIYRDRERLLIRMAGEGNPDALRALVASSNSRVSP
jgi:uncharacterized coiled-coil DUF342 family protein